MTTNHFLCIMAGIFLAGTTFFFKDKSNTLQKENIKLKHQIDSLKVKTK